MASLVYQSRTMYQPIDPCRICRYTKAIMANLGSGLDIFPIPHGWLSDVDRAFAGEVRSFVTKQILHARQSKPVDDALMAEAWRAMAVDLGVQSAIWPERMGGCWTGLARMRRPADRRG